MKNIVRFVFGFIVLFAASAFAQNERFLLPIANEHIDTYMNASAKDGIMAEFPDPDSTKSFAIFFDLGFTVPAGKQVLYKVYGDFPQGSNVMLGAVVDQDLEASYGYPYAHRWVFPIVTRSDARWDSVITGAAVCGYPYRSLCIIRESEWSSSCPTCNPAYYSHPAKTNEQSAYVDALSIVQAKPIVKNIRSFDLRYGNTFIHRNEQGLKTISVNR
jgi:hypothetical protein